MNKKVGTVSEQFIMDSLSLAPSILHVQSHDTVRPRELGPRCEQHHAKFLYANF